MGPPPPPPASAGSIVSSSAAASSSRARASFRPTWQRFDGSSPPPPPPDSPSSVADGGGGGSKGRRGGGEQKRRPTTTTAATATATATHPYGRQYSHVYSRRLAQLRDRCLSSAAAAADAGAGEGEGEDDDARPLSVARILELRESTLSTVVGTAVKDTPARPPADGSYASSSSFANYASYGYSRGDGDDDDDEDGRYPDLGQLEPLRAYFGGRGDGESDTLLLEDESGRVELVPSPCGGSDLDVDGLVTGAVMAVTGRVRAGTGVMEVDRVHFPAPPPPSEEVVSPPEAAVRVGPTAPGRDGADAGNRNAPLVMLLSGLACGAPSDLGGGSGSISLRRDMVLDYLSGHTDPAHDGAGVCRVIVAGGGCARPPHTAAPPSPSSSTGGRSGRKARDANKAGANDPALPVKELDLFLSELCSSGVPVDYVPGRYDPTNVNWPQRPVHACLLPNVCSFVDLMRRAPNPYEAEVGGRVVLGTDGTNVADLRRFAAKRAARAPTGGGDGCGQVGTEGEGGGKEEEGGKEDDDKTELEPLSPLEAMESTLRFGHVAPTGPDSLHTFPSSEMDPFVIDRVPDVYFAGGFSDFDTGLYHWGHGGDGEGGRRTRMVCVPSFAATGMAALLNLETLECQVISFDDVHTGEDGDVVMEE